MFKLVLEKAEEPEIKLPTSAGSSKKQESSRKTSISALLTMPKPLTVWITISPVTPVQTGTSGPPVSSCNRVLAMLSYQYTKLKHGRELKEKEEIGKKRRVGRERWKEVEEEEERKGDRKRGKRRKR